jgi:hypothetical protein
MLLLAPAGFAVTVLVLAGMTLNVLLVVLMVLLIVAAKFFGRGKGLVTLRASIQALVLLARALVMRSRPFMFLLHRSPFLVSRF